MPAEWTPPKDWTSEPIYEADFDAMTNNDAWLKDPTESSWNMDEVSDYTTTSATFVDVDATEGKGKHTIVTEGGWIEIVLTIVINQSAGNTLFDIEMDGASIGNGSDGIAYENSSGNRCTLCVRWRVKPSAASHNFVLRWRVTAGTGTIYAGTTYGGFFGVREN